MSDITTSAARGQAAEDRQRAQRMKQDAPDPTELGEGMGGR
jgi:hypothetical protein